MPGIEMDLYKEKQETTDRNRMVNQLIACVDEARYVAGRGADSPEVFWE
jgi:hypothetical protein